MKYTYRDECILQENGDIGSFIFLGIWICVTLGIFMMDGYLIYIEGSNGFGNPVVGGVFAIATAAIGITIYRSIHKQRNKALAIRCTAMEQGVRSTGRIVDAGWELERQDYDTWDENDNRVRKTKYSRNYWLDVDYCDPKSGEAKRRRAAYMLNSNKVISRITSTEMGYEFRYDNLRFTHAVWLAAAGCTPRFITSHMGYGKLQQTYNLYDYITEDMEAKSRTAIENFLGRISGS